MNEKKWEETLSLSRLNRQKEDFQVKVKPILDYVARLEERKISCCHTVPTFTLHVGDLRMEVKGESLNPIALKRLTQHFKDSYFAVPKVLEEEGEL